MNLLAQPPVEPTAADHRHDALPWHQRIREALRDSIRSGDFAPGQRLPSESDLMQRYGVSRITVRQALQPLEQHGLIVKVAGKGSFVAVDKPYQPLARLQGLAEAMQSQGRAIHNRVLEVAEVEAGPQVALRLQLAQGERVTRIRRVRLLDGRPLSLDVTWLPRWLGERVARGDLANRDIFVMLEHDFAIPLGHADLALDAGNAEEPIASELEVATGSALLRVDRLTHDRAGRPIDYEHLHCRGDNFQFRLRIDRQGGAQQ